MIKQKRSLKNSLQEVPNKIVLSLLWFYRKIFSPSVGILRHIPFYPKPSCIFYPTCSEYAVVCFKEQGFFQATKKTLNRIWRCHPRNEPRVDLP